MGVLCYSNQVSITEAYIKRETSKYRLEVYSKEKFMNSSNLYSNVTEVALGPNGSGISFQHKHFDEGRFRFAHKGIKWTQQSTTSGDITKFGEQCVVKKMKSGAVFTSTAWDYTFKIYDRARRLAQQFKKEVDFSVDLHFTDVSKYTVDHGVFTQPEYVVAEDYLQGKFLKWCSNYGYISPEAKSNDAIMPAFVHWSWLHTKGQEMVCDLQGTRDENGYHLTDPVILSLNNTYGETDMGIEGMAMFFMNHQCNDICKGWRRPEWESFKRRILREKLAACQHMQSQVNNATSYRFEMKFPPATKDIVTRVFLQIAQAQ